MTKGTPSKGRQTGKKSHIYCRRCGSKSYHISKKVCSSCGYGSTKKLRSFSWQS